MKRKYFGTDGVRGKVGQFPITPEFAMKLGWALGQVIPKADHKRKVLIGKDTRNSGYMFESALLAGLSAAGIDGCFLGPIPTPAIATLTRELNADAGFVISASHNPYMDNGIKIFSGRGFKLPDTVELEIESYIDQPIQVVDSGELGKATRINDAAERYISFCKKVVPGLDLKDLKIVIDCANGAGYKVGPKLLRDLGAEVIAIGVEPDGLNINRGCGSTHPELLQETVVAEKADLGIALDGDADRLIMVDHQGKLVDGDQLIFIIAKHLRDIGQFKGGVVGTVMSNLGLEVALKEMNIPFIRAKVGDRYVMDQLKANDWILGGESSGHIIYMNATTTGDGLVSALLVLSAVIHFKKTLADLKQGMQKLPQKLINVRVKHTFDLEQQTELWELVETLETELSDEGRILLRASGTEPVIRVMTEGYKFDVIAPLAEQIAAFIQDNM